MSALFRLTDIDAGSGSVIASKLLALWEPLAGVAASIEAMLGLPFPTVLVIAGSALEIMAGVLIAMNILVRPASIALLTFTAIGIYGLQWSLQDGLRPDQLIRTLNELSIMGALLILCSRVRWAD
jgi:putative oxidoreductase